MGTFCARFFESPEAFYFATCEPGKRSNARLGLLFPRLHKLSRSDIHKHFAGDLRKYAV